MRLASTSGWCCHAATAVQILSVLMCATPACCWRCCRAKLYDSALFSAVSAAISDNFTKYETEQLLQVRSATVSPSQLHTLGSGCKQGAVAALCWSPCSRHAQLASYVLLSHQQPWCTRFKCVVWHAIEGNQWCAAVHTPPPSRQPALASTTHVPTSPQILSALHDFNHLEGTLLDDIADSITYANHYLAPIRAPVGLVATALAAYAKAGHERADLFVTLSR